MEQLADRLNLFSESQTLKVAKLSRELKAQGKDIISLSLGEPDFPTPDHIKIAAKKAIDDNFSYYTPVVGYLDLREAICRKFKRENNLNFSPEQIVVSTGAKQSIANAVLSIVNPGDEVIIPAPYWVSYSEMIKLAEGVPVYVQTSVAADFKINAQQLADAITPKTKLFMFSSPCNPSGSVYSKAELAELVAVFEKNPDIYILSDEIYEHINFDTTHTSIAEFESVSERCIVINGLSKAFAMTGWRLGYMGASLAIAKACDKMQGQFTSATCSIAQRAAISALDSPLTTTMTMKAAFQKRRDLVYELIKEIPGFITNKPAGAFYFFPDVTYYFGKKHAAGTINNAEDLCMYLLTEANVAVVSGDSFGSPNNIRFSYATTEENLRTAMQRIKVELAKLV